MTEQPDQPQPASTPEDDDEQKRPRLPVPADKKRFQGRGVQKLK